MGLYKEGVVQGGKGVDGFERSRSAMKLTLRHYLERTKEGITKWENEGDSDLIFYISMISGIMNMKLNITAPVPFEVLLVDEPPLGTNHISIPLHSYDTSYKFVTK